MPDILNILSNLRMVFLTIFMGLGVYYLVIYANYKLKDQLPIKFSKKRLIYLVITIMFFAILYKLISSGGFIVDVIFIIFISTIFAYILNPLVNKIQKRKIKRVVSIIIVYLGLFLFIAILFLTVGPKIVNEINTFIQKMPSYISDLYKVSLDFYDRNLENINKLASTLRIESPEEMLSDTLDMVKKYITTWTVSLADGLVGFFGRLFNLVLIPIVTFYMLKDKDAFKTRAIRSIPWKKRTEVVNLFKEVDKVIGSFIRGQLMVCVFIGVATSVALTIIGIDFSIIIGIFAGVFNIIPYLGPIIGLIPGVLLALIDDPIKVIWVVVSITVIQQIESNFISPKIVGDSVGLHPLVVMLGVMLGGSYFGILGMLLAVPTIATSRILFKFIKTKISKISDEDIF